MHDRPPSLRLVSSRPDIAGAQPRPPLVLICREDPAGGLDLDVIGQDGRARPRRLAPADAARLRRMLGGPRPVSES
jgi:hypothetical protein